MQEHQLNVTDVAWSTDSLRLLSGGFDQAVKEWDTVTGELGYSFDAPGLVQALSYDAVNSNVFYVGSTQKVVTIVDRRQPDSQHATLRNDSFVNTLVVHELEGSLITGDADGMLKTWDLRAQGCVHQLSNDDQHKPISHIHMARPAIGLRGAAEGRHSDDDERRYLGVNSYDNVLRVYDRWVHALARRGDINAAAAAAEASNDSPDVRAL
jgi:COMPASS component SWD3